MSTVEFIFDERKAAQAAAHLLRRHGSSMPYIKLIKLLYLADRQSLIETGYTITGDQLVAMSDGPALNRVLFFIEDRGALPRRPLQLVSTRHTRDRRRDLRGRRPR